ncbi:MAG: thiamine pyrophosphate-dependent dehydrogenase E1 component subunit alpha [Planctomycetes bacterium]|nr:thiamine pyrophosphate-dependent dehydrogenase E1 component subunit alpha [Planctomycetota bacterium]
MILARALDDRMCKLKAQNLVPGSVFTGRGQEAYSAAGGMCLRPGDVFAPLIRDQAGRLAFGETIIDVVRTCMGKRTSSMRGRDGNIHRGNLDIGLLPMISHLGAMVSVVAGMLMARRFKGQLVGNDLTVGMASIGDGGMNAGALHEALNLAAVEKLPFVLLVANNQVAYSTFNDRTFACRDLVDRAVGYGVCGHSCDGTDATACLTTVSDAVARVRRGEGPQMVVATLLRLAGHGLHDPAEYVTPELKSRFGDCIQLDSNTLKVQGILTDADIERIWDDARTRIAAAVEQAMHEPDPDPAQEDWTAYSERDLKKVRS